MVQSVLVDFKGTRYVCPVSSSEDVSVSVNFVLDYLGVTVDCVFCRFDSGEVVSYLDFMNLGC